MSLIRPNRYPNRFDPVSAANPFGAFKNRADKNTQNGSFLEKDWANDQDALRGAILAAAGVSPNGVIDTATNCQVYNELINVLQNMFIQDGTTDGATITGTDYGKDQSLGFFTGNAIKHSAPSGAVGDAYTVEIVDSQATMLINYLFTGITQGSLSSSEVVQRVTGVYDPLASYGTIRTSNVTSEAVSETLGAQKSSINAAIGVTIGSDDVPKVELTGSEITMNGNPLLSGVLPSQWSTTEYVDDNTVRITTGMQIDSAGNRLINIASNLEKDTDAQWTQAGTGGVFPGLTNKSSLNNNEDYAVCVISNGTDVSAGFSTTRAANKFDFSDIPAGYSYFLVDAHQVDDSANVINFSRAGEYVVIESPVDQNLAASLPTSVTSRNFGNPSGVELDIHLFARTGSLGSNDRIISIGDGVAADNTRAFVRTVGTTTHASNHARFITDVQGQLKWISSVGSTDEYRTTVTKYRVIRESL